MQIIDRSLDAVDRLQRRSHLFGFTHAVIKKYGDDSSGYQAALLTYYGFLALFPLILILTTLTSMIASNHPEFKDTILNGVTNYFPVLGSQLAEHITTLHKSSVALIVGLLFTLYGTRGVIDVFRRGVRHIWQEPITDSQPYIIRAAKSLGMVIIGGLGLLAASILAGATAAAGHGVAFHLLSIAVNLLALFLIFAFLINAALPRHVALKETRVGAVVAAIGLVLLQSLGGYLLTRELKSLDALYSYFALSLGLLFWIYLQSQLIYYAVTIAAVSSKKLWPRSLTGKNPTAADKTLQGASGSVH